MNINIDYATRTPIYEQIVSEVEKLVTLEILKSNEQIPSIRELACTLGINPNTVKKAYDILENKGIIISKSTKGTFISNNISKAKEIKINELLKQIKLNVKELENYGLSLEDVLKILRK
ncbi:MAG: GntR family transcriptional regulator [Firmicutes bacterium]|nr:GntR family transcriptional regulator [Bacillota bacterium]